MALLPPPPPHGNNCPPAENVSEFPACWMISVQQKELFVKRGSWLCAYVFLLGMEKEAPAKTVALHQVPNLCHSRLSRERRP